MNRLYILVDTIFISLYLLAVLVLWEFDRLPMSISVFDFILIGLATARLSDIISTDEVTTWMRRPFVKMETTEIADREVQTRMGRGTGLRKLIGDMLSCPWCVGVWVAAGLVCAYSMFPRFVWLLIVIMAIAEIGALVQTISTILVRLVNYLKGLGVPEENL